MEKTLQTQAPAPAVGAPSDTGRLSELAGRLVRDRSPHATARRRRWLTWALVLLLVGGTVALWQATRPTMVDVTVVAFQRTGPAAQPIFRASGYVTYPTTAILQTTARTPAVALLYQEGQFVEQGAVLARFDNRELIAQERAQRVALEDARTTLVRTQNLHAAGAASAADLQRAQTALSQAEANIALTDAQLASTVLAAPFSGIITERLVNLGEIASAGVYEIVDNSQTLVEVDVSQDDIAKIEPSQPAVVTLDAYPDWEYSARVYEISARADQAKNTVRVKVEVLDPDARYKPQLSARVFFAEEMLPENRAITAMLAVDRSSIVTEGDTSYVWIVRNGRAVRTSVETGRDLGGSVEVMAGLQENDQIITNLTSGNIRDGQRVSPRPTG